MISGIANRACNSVFDPEFCKGAYGPLAGSALLVGSGILGHIFFRYLWRGPTDQIAPLIDRMIAADPDDSAPVDAFLEAVESRTVYLKGHRVQLLHWSDLENCLEEAQYKIDETNRLQWNERFKEPDYDSPTSGVLPQDLSHPIMWGETDTGARFLTAKVRVWDSSNPSNYGHEVYSIFERWLNGPLLTTIADATNITPLKGGSYEIKFDERQRSYRNGFQSAALNLKLYQLLRGEEIMAFPHVHKTDDGRHFPVHFRYSGPPREDVVEDFGQLNVSERDEVNLRWRLAD